MGTRRSTRISNSDAQKHSQNPGLDTSQGKWLTLDWDIKEQTPFRLPRKRGGLPFGIRDEVLLEPPPPFKLIHANAYPSSIPRVELGEAHICGCSAIDNKHNCQPQSGCLNRRLYQECEFESCPAGVLCQNRNIQLCLFPSTDVFPTRDGRGWGLRLSHEAAPVRAGAILCEYTGEVLTLDECRRRLDDPKRGKDFYFASLDSKLVLDAKHMGSVARFANHSCRPNCELQKWSVRGEPRVVLVASRIIIPGEELSYNYRADTLGGLVTRQRCYCGAPNCGGFIGAAVQEVEADIFWAESVKILGTKVAKLSQVQELVERGESLGMLEKGREMVCLRKLAEEGEAWIQRWNDACEIATHELMREVVSSAPTDLQIDALTDSRRFLRRIRSVESAALRLRSFYTSEEEPIDSNLNNSKSSGYSRSIDSSSVLDEEVHGNGPTAIPTAPPPQIVRSRGTPDKCFYAKPTMDNVTKVLRDICAIEREGVILECGVKESLLAVLRPVDAWARECLEVLGFKSPAAAVGYGGNNLKELKIINKKTLESALSPCLEALEKRLEEVAGLAIVRDEASRNHASHQRRINAAKNRRDNIKRKQVHQRQQQRPLRWPRRGSTSGNNGKENIHALVTAQQQPSVISSHPIDDDGVSEAPLHHAQQQQQSLYPCKATTTPSQEEVKKENQGTCSSDSGSDEHTLHCLCRLPEHVSGKGMRTLVKCNGCKCWFHPACINSTEPAILREEKGPQGFLCPMCQHAAGCVTNLVIITTTSTPCMKRNGKPELAKLESLAETGNHLPVTDMAGLSFLLYIIDKYKTWQAESEAILTTVEAYVQGGEKMDDILHIGDAAVHRGGLDLPSVGRNLGFESRLVECLGQMLYKGMPLRSVVNTSVIDRKLRCMLWRLTASLLSPEACRLLRASSNLGTSKQQQRWHLSPQDEVKLMESRSWTGIPSVLQLEAAWKSGKELRADMSLVSELKINLNNVIKFLREGLSPHKSNIEAAAPALKLQAKWLRIDHDYAYARALAFYSRTNAGKGIPRQGQQQEQKEEEEEGVEICICREREEGFMLSCDICNDWFHANCVGIRHSKVTTSPNFVYHCITCCEASGKPYIHAWSSMVSLTRKRKKEQLKATTKPCPKKQMTEPKSLKSCPKKQTTKPITLKSIKHAVGTVYDAHLIPGPRQRAFEMVKIVAAQLYPNFIPPTDRCAKNKEKR